MKWWMAEKKITNKSLMLKPKEPYLTHTSITVIIVLTLLVQKYIDEILRFWWYGFHVSVDETEKFLKCH
jgi:hypothetical protein